MKTRQWSLLMPFACGMLLTWAVLASFGSWWPDFWFPFVGATTALYVVCRCLSRRPMAAGFIAALPGLAIPALLWFLVLDNWRVLEEARARGGLYTILTMGDPHSIVTIVRLLVFPTLLVLASGLSAGALATLVSNKENRKLANNSVHDSLGPRRASAS